ncbi:MAG: N-acetylneuraminate synthase family protein [Phycisphaeraceae bacterium]|nr:N-acetylneuraminate synthase family protein [Phycisphaeraceae bacterium]
MINGRKIGRGNAPYIIAELGVNHDGDESKAIALVDAAAMAGADAVKLQWFEAHRLMSKASTLALYQAAAGEQDPLAMLQRLELPVPAMRRVLLHARERGLHAVMTIFNTELVSSAHELPIDAFKTASPDIIHKPLITALAATGLPLILSTGASTLPEVGRALTWLGPAALTRAAVLQCVSCYPTPARQASLLGMQALADVFPVPVGYSDHTTDETMGMAAVMLGASIIEKHLTLNRTDPGPDHAASADPDGFAKYAAHIRDAWHNTQEARRVMRLLAQRARTSKRAAHMRRDFIRDWRTLRAALDPRSWGLSVEKTVLDIERDVREKSRQSIVPRRDLPAGHILTRDDVTFKRPGTGLPPYMLDAVLGLPLMAPAAADYPLSASHVRVPGDHADAA